VGDAAGRTRAAPSAGYTTVMSTPGQQSENDEPVRENPGQDNEQTADPAEGDTAPTVRPPDEGSPATGETE
jgi:hypothetical protein